MGHWADGERTYDKEVPSYWWYAIVAVIFNPVFGLMALFFSWESQRCVKNGWKYAKRYSDISFSLSIMSIIGTILCILLVYAFGGFPADTYFDRNEIIQGVKSTTTILPNVTMAATG